MTQLPLEAVLPLSSEEDSEDCDDALVVEMLGDTAMDQERRKRNREAARKVRMKKNRRHEDVKQEYFRISAENTRLKYEVTQEEKHLEKWIRLAEMLKMKCPDFKYTIPGTPPLINRGAPTTMTNTATFSQSGSMTTAVCGSAARQVDSSHQPKKVIHKLRRIIDIMKMKEGDIFTTETNMTSANSSNSNHETVMDPTPNRKLCVMNTEVGTVTMDTNTPAHYSTGVRSATIKQNETYSNMTLHGNNMSTVATVKPGSSILVEKLDSILDNVGQSTTMATMHFNGGQSSVNAGCRTLVTPPPVNTSNTKLSTEPVDSNIYDFLSIARLPSSSKTLQPPTHTVQRVESIHQVLPSEPTITHRVLPSEPTTTHQILPSEPTTTHQVLTSEPTITHRVLPSEPTTTHQVLTSEPTITHRVLPSEPTTTHQILPSEPTTTHQVLTSEPTITHRVLPSEPTTTHQILPSEPTTTHQILPSEPTTTQQVFTSEPTTTHQVLAMETTDMFVTSNVTQIEHTSSLISQMPQIPRMFKIPQTAPPPVATKAMLPSHITGGETSKSSAPEPSIIPNWDILEPSQGQKVGRSPGGKRSAPRASKVSQKKRSKGKSATRSNGGHYEGHVDEDYGGLFHANIGEKHDVMMNTMSSNPTEAEVAINNIKTHLIQDAPAEQGMMALLNSNMYSSMYMPMMGQHVMGSNTESELHNIIAGGIQVTNDNSWL